MAGTAMLIQWAKDTLRPLPFFLTVQMTPNHLQRFSQLRSWACQQHSIRGGLVALLASWTEVTWRRMPTEQPPTRGQAVSSAEEA